MKAKIKGRVVWADMKQGRFESKPICRINEFTGAFSDMTAPALILPLDDLDGLVEQAAESLNKGYVAPYRYAAAHAVLSSLGVRFPKQRKAKS